ncbi:oxidoreductase family protein [Pseudonocardia halophobica]|uniref:oxidoreductase family protein n=1 Tax=Pseudonocardia halophobica TaxID=29401 RepID=UPI003D9034E9
MERETCGTGQLGDSYRFTLGYDEPGAGPATVVAKFASEDAASREFGRRSGYYRAEINFYTRIAPHSSMSLPRPLHAELAPNETDFVLLMEDLAPARSVDQLDGCTADDMALVMEQTAILHAESWYDSCLAAEPWLGGPVAIFNEVTDSYTDVIRTFPELCGDLVPEADLAEAAGLIPHALAWKRLLNDPQCLWHSDIRADNVLFDAQDGARPVVLLDWQGVGFGRGTIDVALCLGTSLAVEDRRVHERELVAAYHRALVANGVTGYSAEEAWADYRVHAVHGLQVGVFGLGAVKRTPRGDQMWKNWIERTAAQVRDLDSYAVLAKR